MNVRRDKFSWHPFNEAHFIRAEEYNFYVLSGPECFDNFYILQSADR